MTRDTDRAALPPAVWVLTRDERLYRFFEIELSYLGVEAIPAPWAEREIAFVVIDTDTHALPDLWDYDLPCDARVLAYGPAPVESPASGTLAGVEWLRRPAPLERLEEALRRLAADVTAVPPPLYFATEGGAGRTAGVSPAPREEGMTLDAATATVTVGDRSIPLSPTEWDLLTLLLSHAGETVSKETLTACIGGGGNSVEVYIYRLRSKLEKPIGRRLIETVRGNGYVFRLS